MCLTSRSKQIKDSRPAPTQDNALSRPADRLTGDQRPPSRAHAGLYFQTGSTLALRCRRAAPAAVPAPNPLSSLDFRPPYGGLSAGSFSGPWTFCTTFHRELRDGPNFAPFVGLHEVRPSGVGGGAVEKRSFVVKEQRFIRPLRCVKCGGNAHLTRRSPDPVKKDGSEIRIFECHECGHQTERIAKG